MARSHARLLTSIWDDPDWRTLSADAQRLYMLLLSQPSLNHVGVMPLTVRRWARGCDATTADDVWDALGELAERRYVVIDEDTEELLIRSLLRNDRVFTQPKLLISCVGLAGGLSSGSLARALLVELDRLPLDDLSDAARTSAEGHLTSMRKELERVSAAQPLPRPVAVPDTQSDTHPDTQSDTPSDGYPSDDSAPSDTQSDTHPDTPRVRARASRVTPAPTPTPDVSDGADEPPSHDPPDDQSDPPGATQRLVAAFVDLHPRRPPSNVVGQVARHVGALLAEGFEPEAIHAGLVAYAAKGKNPSSLPSFVNEAANRPRPPSPERTGRPRIEYA